jgi:hypothetical protein
LTVNLRSVVAGAVLAALAVAAVRWWWPDERTAITRRLHELAALASAPEQDDTLGRVANLAALRRYLAQDVTIDAGTGVPPIKGRDALLGLAARGQTAGIELALADVQVHIERNGLATVYLTATLTRRGAARDGIDARELLLSMQKANGQWIISRVEPLRTLERRD